MDCQACHLVSTDACALPTQARVEVVPAQGPAWLIGGSASDGNSHHAPQHGDFNLHGQERGGEEAVPGQDREPFPHDKHADAGRYH